MIERLVGGLAVKLYPTCSHITTEHLAFCSVDDKILLVADTA